MYVSTCGYGGSNFYKGSVGFSRNHEEKHVREGVGDEPSVIRLKRIIKIKNLTKFLL